MTFVAAAYAAHGRATGPRVLAVDVEPRPSGDRPETLDRVLCGVDGSPGGIAAVRQAVRLSAPGSGLLLVSVAAVAAAAHPQTAVALEARAALSLREAERAYRIAKTVVLRDEYAREIGQQAVGPQIKFNWDPERPRQRDENWSPEEYLNRPPSGG